MNRKVILYIAVSLDGFIAKQDDNIDFLSVVEKKGEDYGYKEFLNSVDTIILGRRTYEKIKSMGFEYPADGREVYILSGTQRNSEGNMRYYSGNLKDLIIRLKSEMGKNIFCDGGSEIVNALLKDQLIDEFIISIIPVLLGDGIPLFRGGRPEANLRLIRSVQFEKGLVQLHYERFCS